MDYNKFGNCIVAADFDGTVTEQDSNVGLINGFGNHVNQAIEDEFSAGRIGTREAMLLHFQELSLSREEYDNFIAAAIDLAPGFIDFQQKLARVGVPLIIISGGYTNAITALKNKYDLKLNVLANKLKFRGKKISIEFLHQDVVCAKSFGPCGNCKARHIQALKKTYDSVIFIGDGLTDRCAAEEADYVFAKNKLAEYCSIYGIPYTCFKDFRDISVHLFERE